MTGPTWLGGAGISRDGDDFYAVCGWAYVFVEALGQPLLSTRCQRQVNHDGEHRGEVPDGVLTWPSPPGSDEPSPPLGRPTADVDTGGLT